MAISSNGLRTNDMKADAVRPYGKKKDKKKKKKQTTSEKSAIKTYKEVTDESFIMNPSDWQESADEMSFDDMNSAVCTAMHSEYDKKMDSSTGYGGGDYVGNGMVCRYYVYKMWPSTVVFKRAYGNKNPEDPLFMMHSYEMDGDKAVLGAGMPVTMGFMPAGSESEDFMTAMREADEISLDDPELAKFLAEEDGPDDEDEDELSDDEDEESDKEDEEADDEEEVQEAHLREGIENIKEQDIREEFEHAIDAGCRLIEGKNGSFILENMAVIGAKSKNDRTYPAETRKKALKLFEGAKAYANHQRKGEENHARGVAEAIGIHRNVYYDPASDMIRSNLHLSPTDFVKGYIIPHAKANPSIIGNSINGGGKLSADGKEVLEITKISSIDLVTDPATTNGLFESVDNTNSGGEEIMTLKELLENKALSEEARAHFREELEVELSVSSMQEEIETLKEENAEYKLKEQRLAKRAEVKKLLKESKLPEESKNDEELLEILEEATPERRKAIIARFEKAAASASSDEPPARSGMREKDISEGTSNGGGGTPDRAKMAKVLLNGVTARR